VGRRESTTKCRAHVCGRCAVLNRAPGQGNVRPPSNQPHRVRCHFFVTARAHHQRPARPGISRSGIFHAQRGPAATRIVCCSHVSAHPMPDNIAELISQARAQYDSDDAAFAREDVGRSVETHATLDAKNRAVARGNDRTVHDGRWCVQPAATQSLTCNRNKDPSPWLSQLNAKS
jgi:hypothetical protein